ncbi:MAG: rRNA cytosine-C5-methylase [Acetobacteraceae bacterium]|nr:rRNA cytosine-C5-methylase [Acetobacteraceae bacterium]
MDAREAGLFLLESVLAQHRRLEAALDALPSGDARDRGFAHLIAATVLRRLGTLDAVLDQHLRGPTPERVRMLLRIGAAQLLFLGTAPHAAVGTAVALAKHTSEAHGRLVNAVLRRVAATGRERIGDLDTARLDTPDWLWRSWWGAYGAATYDIAAAHAAEPPLDLTPAPGAFPPPDAAVLANGSWRLPPGTQVTALPGFAEGTFWVQDAAASLPARLVGAGPGERVIDLCAAPGGKTLQLVAAGALVTAIDRDPARLARVGQNLGRLGMQAETLAADATRWCPAVPVDAVLLDAPCTATGTIRRHPDVLRLKSARDVAAIVPLQDSLMDAACAMLRPGGRMVYAVCSLQPEEGPARIEAALARLPLRLDPIAEGELAAIPEARTPEGCLRTLPCHWADRGGMDGFFAARLIRADA